MDLNKIVNAQDAPLRPSESPQSPPVVYKPAKGNEQTNGSPQVARTERLPSISISPRTNSQDIKKEPSSLPQYTVQASPPTAAAKQPPRKRRIKPPPIWAQRCQGTKPLKKYKKAANSAHQNNQATENGQVPQAQSTHPMAGRVDQSQPQCQPVFNDIIPYDHVVRTVCDFLYQSVVGDDTIGTGDAGSIPSTSGQFEIEAKLGRLVDRNSSQRVYFPVADETSLKQECDVSFESFMTQEQHEYFNNYLNAEVAKSHGGFNHKTQKPRTPLQYRRLREVDSFYKLPSDEMDKLPPVVQRRLKMSSRNFTQKEPKVRVTRDQKTGQVTAQIIKHRLMDLHVYCPRSTFDWRVSVSLELNWDGDPNILPPDTHASNRNKDRISYQLAFCQLDLTQVTTADSKSHELEVEVSSSEVKRQGKLVASTPENQYVQLVKGFIDNVRTLSRLFPV